MSCIFNLNKAISLMILLLMFYSQTFAQDTKVDSLKRSYESIKSRNEKKIDAANNIALNIYNTHPDEAIPYLQSANKWSKEINYLEGESTALWIKGRMNSIKNKGEAMDLFNEALSLAQKANFKKGICRIQISIAILYTNQFEFKKSDSIFQATLPMAELLNDVTILSNLYTNMSRNPEREGRTWEAIDIAMKGVEFSKKNNDPRLLANAYFTVARNYYKMGKLKEALEYNLESLAIKEQMDDKIGQIISSINIAGVHYAQKDSISANKILDKAYLIAEELNNSYYMASCLLNKGVINNENAVELESLEKALAISKPNDINLHLSCLQNITAYHLRKSNLEEADKYIKELIALNEKIPNDSRMAEIEMTKGMYYNKRKEFHKAIIHLEKAYKQFQTLNLNEGIIKTLGMLVDSHAEAGNFKTSLLLHIDYKRLNDSIFNEKNIRELTQLESSYEYDKQKKEYELQRAENEMKIKNQRIILIGSGTLSILVAGLLFMFYRSTRLKKRLLALELENVNQEMVMREQEIAAAKLRLVQNAERDTYCLKMLQNIEDESEGSSKDNMRSLISYFKNQSDNTSWKEFETQFIKVSPQFYDKLNALYPNLTPNERKLCVFLKLNMSSKDINKITFQSEEALKKARMRLRKKLNLDRETNLNAFFQNI